MNTETDLEKLKTDIEKMPKMQHIEVLNILKKNKIKVNENKNGIYVNMSYLPKETVEELDKYVKYIKMQSEILQSPTPLTTNSNTALYDNPNVFTNAVSTQNNT